MKSLFCAGLIIVHFLVSAQPGDSEQLRAENLKLCETEKGTITYSVTAGGTGSVTFAFDRYGLLTATRTQIDYELYGVATKMDEIDIRDGSTRFIYDLSRNTGRKKQVKTEVDLLKYKSLPETRKSMHEVNGGILVGTEIILGKETEHWQFASGPIREAWYWDGLILKAEIKRPRITYSYEATAFELDVAEISYPTIEIADN